MKKYIVGLIVLVAIAGLASLGSRYVGTHSAVESIQDEATQQHMPRGFFGVKWLTSTEELRSIRPDAAPDPGGMLGESVTFLDRPAKIDYYTKTGNVLMFAIHFAGPTTKAEFESVDETLDRDYGPLSVPKIESDEYGQKYCSHRQSERFGIDHCIRLQGQTPLESIVFYRSKSRQSG